MALVTLLLCLSRIGIWNSALMQEQVRVFQILVQHFISGTINFKKLNQAYFNALLIIIFPGTSVLRSNRELVPGEWVTVTLARDLREARLSVNGEPVVTQRIHGSSKPLILQTPLYVGGYDSQKIRLAPGMNVDQSFTGCISEVIFTCKNCAT